MPLIAASELTRCLVTGGSGFVGRAVLSHMSTASRYHLRAALRRDYADLPAGVEYIHPGEITPDMNWAVALREVRVILHAAARVHIMKDDAHDSLAEFRRVNVDGTLNLARQAAASGVKRFIFISSIKVNGESTLPGQPYTADDTPAPSDPYGTSKHEAERGLMKIAGETGM